MRDSAEGFIREVDEAVRQDRWLALWKHYGRFLTVAALAIVAGTAIGVGWRAYQQDQQRQLAERYAAAEQLADEDRAAEAAAAFSQIAQESEGGYGVLARFRAAAAEGEAGDEEAKAATLEALSGDDEAANVYRELGELLALQDTFDTVDPDALITKLTTLAAPGSPWRHSALELEALARIRAGDLEGARATLDTLLADPATPGRLSRRAAELMASLGGPEAGATGATDATGGGELGADGGGEVQADEGGEPEAEAPQ